MRFINDTDTITTTKDLEYDIYKDVYVWGWNGDSYDNVAKGYHDGRYIINDDESTEWRIATDETEDA